MPHCKTKHQSHKPRKRERVRQARPDGAGLSPPAHIPQEHAAAERRARVLTRGTLITGPDGDHSCGCAIAVGRVKRGGDERARALRGGGGHGEERHRSKSR